MPREDAATKARRLLVEGRLIVDVAGGAEILARCRGDSARVHVLGFASERGWFCDCDARSRCSHVIALQLVTLRPSSEPSRHHEREAMPNEGGIG